MNFKYLNADKKKTPKEQIRSKGVFNLQLNHFLNLPATTNLDYEWIRRGVEDSVVVS